MRARQAKKIVKRAYGRTPSPVVKVYRDATMKKAFEVVGRQQPKFAQPISTYGRPLHTWAQLIFATYKHLVS